MKNTTESCDEVQPLKLKEILKDHNIPFEEKTEENAVVITIEPKSNNNSTEISKSV